MKESLPPSSPKKSSKSRHTRASRGSFSSTKTGRSAVSVKSNIFKRRFSTASMKSQTLDDSSSDGDSAFSNNVSKKTSHADDSDASDTDVSLGETDKDVWFPGHPRDSDIKMEELDQLLNLSDSENAEDSERYPQHINTSTPPSPRTSVSQVQPSHSQQHTQQQQQPHNPEEQPQELNFPPIVHSGVREPTQFYPGTSWQGDSQSTSSEEKARVFGPENPLDNLVYSGLKESLSSSSESPELKKSQSDPQVFDVDVSLTPNINPRDPKLKSFNKLNLDQQQSQRFSFYAPGMENTVHAADLVSLVGSYGSFSTLFKPENGVWFLDCFRPSDIEMKALCRAFGIHPLTAEDILTEESREKFEMFKNYYLVVYHTFEDNEDDDNYLEPIKVYLLVFNEGVISFHFKPVSHCRNVRRRMRQLRDYLTLTSDWVAYAMIDDITDAFAPQIHDIEHEADCVEDSVYIDHQNQEVSALLKRLGLARKRTMQLMRMLSGKADVVKGFAKRCTETNNMPGAEMALYLGDIQDHIVTMYQNLSAYEKIFSRSHFNYMGLLQMEFVDSSNRMTGVLGKVTVLGTILLPMNLITGLFGMNVKVPGQDGSNLGWFFGILGVVLLSVGVLLVGGIFYIRKHT